MAIIWIIIIVIIAGILAWTIGAYNGFIRLRTRTEEAWADIDVQLKRRYDLIPNLIETVKGYASHEKEVLESVIEARNMAMNAESGGDAASMAQAEGMLTGALKSLFALSEAYPDLKANENFLELQRELTDTEDKIQAARRFYNANVRDLNIQVESFPSNIIANWFKFGKREFFELEEGSEQREPVKVDFDS